MSIKRLKFLEYEGSNYLRQRLVLATITGRAIRISRIRYADLDQWRILLPVIDKLDLCPVF